MSDELTKRKCTISAFLKESSYLQHKTGNSEFFFCLFPSNRTGLVMSILGFCISHGRLQNKSTSQFENVIQLSGIKVLCGRRHLFETRGVRSSLIIPKQEAMESFAFPDKCLFFCQIAHHGNL